MKLPAALIFKAISYVPEIVAAIAQATRRRRSAPPPPAPPIVYPDPHCWNGVSWIPGARPAQRCIYCGVARTVASEATHCPGLPR